MNDLRSNIEIIYLYRDAGNYKLFGSKVFSNASGLELEVVRQGIESKLIDGLSFVPESWEMDRLRFDNFDRDEDHDWHEFVSIDVATRNAMDAVDIRDLLDKLESKS